MGHYASSCPRADGPKLRAARVVDDREEAAEVEIELDPEEDPGPAQLEPELEGQTSDDEGQWAPDHEYSELDDYPDGSQYEEGDMDTAFAAAVVGIMYYEQDTNLRGFAIKTGCPILQYE